MRFTIVLLAIAALAVAGTQLSAQRAEGPRGNDADRLKQRIEKLRNDLRQDRRQDAKPRGERAERNRKDVRPGKQMKRGQRGMHPGKRMRPGFAPGKGMFPGQRPGFAPGKRMFEKRRDMRQRPDRMRMFEKRVRGMKRGCR